MQPDSLKIKPVTIQEVNSLREICIQTFSETYEHLNTPENFRKYIDTNFNPEQLTTELNNNNSFTYFLQVDYISIGYMKLNIEGSQTENIEGEGMEIERIYVLKEFQGNNYGKSLIKFAFEKAAELKKRFVWLGVWERNQKAIAFYEKNGFKKFDSHIFVLGDDAQTDYLYKRMI